MKGVLKISSVVDSIRGVVSEGGGVGSEGAEKGGREG